ncbi:hypothetical protein JNUCC0626_48255 [Lentzea sp. JNUCC 0626]|uniref:hypothetical protein n=1 Tax=Lentzea sp. JNUCC 0626 TaxID=3367513 RepID=UPI00374A66A3
MLRIISTVSAVAVATLLTVPAAQADSPAGQHLIAFSKVPSETRSVLVERHNNVDAPNSTVCLSSLPSGKTYKSSVHVDNDSTPDLTFYASSNCTGDGQSSGFGDVTADNLAYTWVSWRNYHPYWGSVGLAS